MPERQPIAALARWGSTLWLGLALSGCGPVAPAVDPQHGDTNATQPQRPDLGSGPMDQQPVDSPGKREDWEAKPWPPPEHQLGERLPPGDPPDQDPSPKDPVHKDPPPRDPIQKNPPPKPVLSCPATPQNAKSCPSYGQRCTYPAASKITYCSCTSICSGVDWGDENPGNVWACQTRDKRCPDEVPKAGERCRTRKLQCGYGTCGGASATCEKGKWEVLEWSPPA